MKYQFSENPFTTLQLSEKTAHFSIQSDDVALSFSTARSRIQGLKVKRVLNQDLSLLRIHSKEGEEIEIGPIPQQSANQIAQEISQAKYTLTGRAQVKQRFVDGAIGACAFIVLMIGFSMAFGPRSIDHAQQAANQYNQPSVTQDREGGREVETWTP